MKIFTALIVVLYTSAALACGGVKTTMEDKPAPIVSSTQTDSGQ